MICKSQFAINENMANCDFFYFSLDFSEKRVYNENIRRRNIMVIISASQAEDAGSIPVVCSFPFLLIPAELSQGHFIAGDFSMYRLKKYEHTIYASYIGYITQAVVNNFAPLLFLTFVKDYGLTLDKITFITTVNFAVQLIVDLLSSKFADRIGLRLFGGDILARDIQRSRQGIPPFGDVHVRTYGAGGRYRLLFGIYSGRTYCQCRGRRSESGYRRGYHFSCGYSYRDNCAREKKRKCCFLKTVDFYIIVW